MYSCFSVNNYKRLKDLKLERLGRINLIAGTNNVGKTSLLEALWLFGGIYSPDLIMKIQGQRGIKKLNYDFKEGSELPWMDIFYNLDCKKVIVFEGIEDGKQRTMKYSTPEHANGNRIVDVSNNSDMSSYSIRESDKQRSYRSLKLEVNENSDQWEIFLHIKPEGLEKSEINEEDVRESIILPPKFTVSNEILADRYSSYVKKQGVEEANKIARMIDPQIESIDLLTIGKGHPVIHCYMKEMKSPLPLNYMGGGVFRILEILLSLADAENGYLMVDEIENGFHYSNLEKIWNAINESSKSFNTQVFLATHSYECIQAAKEVFKEEGPETFVFHRIDELEGGQLEAKTYDVSMIEAALDMELEVR